MKNMFRWIFTGVTRLLRRIFNFFFSVVPRWLIHQIHQILRQRQIFNVFVVVTGETRGAHETFIRRLQHGGMTQKESVEESDHILAFCPSPSRIGIDIMEAMGKIPCGKPVILVVMHHRYDVPAYLDDSSKHVTREDVKLTVDTLFWQREFLKCCYNEEAFSKVLEAVHS